MKSIAACLFALVATALLKLAPNARGQATPALTTIYNFNDTDGLGPVGKLVQGNNGNFYGVTQTGGANNNGTVFEFTPGGTLVFSYSFSVLTGGFNTDGTQPTVGLAKASNGNFYGAASGGGANGAGTIFEITSAGVLTTLYPFSGSDGRTPNCVIVGKDGNLYGTTKAGGTGGSGTFFRLTTTGVLTTLYDFPNTSDVYSPTGVVQASDDNFYGITFDGTGVSTIYKITPAGVMSALYTFSSGQLFPTPLILGRDGDLYGTNINGGAHGAGMVFRATRAGVLTDLFDFNNSGLSSYDNGYSPSGTLTEGADGNFYGTTRFGGNNPGGSGGYGALFKITPAGVLTTLHSFDGADGYGGTYAGYGSVGLTQGSDGYFYGVSSAGGETDTNDGTIYRLNPDATPGTVQFAASAASVNENAGSVTISVTRTGGSVGTVTVNCATSNGTAVAGTDYTSTNTTLTWTDSVATAQTFTVPITDRGLSDGSTKTFTVALSSPTNGGKLGAPHKITVKIHENDAKPTQPPVIISARTAKATVGATFTYQIKASNSPTSYAASGLPSNLGLDGSSGLISGTPTAAGTYSISLSATNAGGTGSATLTLTVAPVPSTVQFAAASNNTTENAGSVALSVTRTGGSAGAAMVHYATANGSAIAGTDYTAASGTLSWADGDTAPKTITVSIKDRGLYDGSTKTFSIKLASASGASLGAPVTASVNILEDDLAPKPTVAITSPPSGLTLVPGEAVTFVLSVDDPGGLLKSVQVSLNGQPTVKTSGPFPYAVNTKAPDAPGTYTFTAVATDKDGRTSASNAVTVKIAAASTNPPTTGLLTPVNGLNLKAGASVILTAAAQVDAATALDRVIIYADGEAVATFDGQGHLVGSAHGGGPVRQHADSGPPVSNAFSASYQLPGTDKLISIIVVAIDKLGLSSVSSVSSIHSTVTDDRAPLVAISNFGATAQVTVGSANAVHVTASDPDAAQKIGVPGFAPQTSTLDGVLSRLALYVNGALSELFENDPPASASFTFSPSAAGEYVLSTVATDGSGLSTVSDPVVVTATAPVVTVMTAGDGTAVEHGGQKGKAFVLRTGGTSAPLTVSYKVKGSAKAGVDYKPLPGVVTIPAGASKAKIKIKPLDNPEAGTRKAKIKLLPATDGSYEVGNPFVAKIKVIDNG